jgi:hypothetical protein
MRRIGKWELAVALVCASVMVVVSVWTADYVFAGLVAIVAIAGTFWRVRRGLKAEDADEHDDPDADKD